MKSYFVTLLSSENYLDGILCLNQNLLNVASKYPLLCVVSDDVAIDVIPYLKFFDIEYVIVNKHQYCCGSSDSVENIRLSNTATKIAIYGIDMLDKSIYIDGDTFVLKNVDNLFNYPAGSATIIFNNNGNTRMAMSSLFSFVPCRSMYNLLQVCIKYAGKMLDGGIIGAIFNDNIQNDIMVFPPEIYHKVLPLDTPSSLADTKDVSIVHFLNSSTKPWQMSDEEFDQHWGKHECMKQYKKCLDAVREKKNKLKKLIETSKLLMNQEIENLNKSLGI